MKSFDFLVILHCKNLDPLTHRFVKSLRKPLTFQLQRKFLLTNDIFGFKQLDRFRVLQLVVIFGSTSLNFVSQQFPMVSCFADDLEGPILTKTLSCYLDHQ